MTSVPFKVVPGRGAASGRNEYRDLGGSIRAQKPRFLERGLDLSGYHEATINADIAPYRFRMHQPLLTFRDIDWHPEMPPENFSFATASLRIDAQTVPALIYYPRPETKGAYASMPPDTMLEILAPLIDSLRYGTTGVLTVNPFEVILSDKVSSKKC